MTHNNARCPTRITNHTTNRQVTYARPYNNNRYQRRRVYNGHRRIFLGRTVTRVNSHSSNGTRDTSRSSSSTLNSVLPKPVERTSPTDVIGATALATSSVCLSDVNESRDGRQRKRERENMRKPYTRQLATFLVGHPRYCHRTTRARRRHTKQR